MACVQEIPLIIADADNPASLESMAGQTKVILALTGPYAKYGTAAVAACVKQGTHWCDLTGKTDKAEQTSHELRPQWPSAHNLAPPPPCMLSSSGSAWWYNRRNAMDQRHN